MARIRFNRIRRTRPLVFACLIILLSVGTLFYVHVHKSGDGQSAISSSPDSKKIFERKPGTPIATADGDPHTGPTVSIDANQGTAIDKQGQAPSQLSTTPSQWISSDSKAITVKQPVTGSTVKNGDYLVGEATVPRVQYRLIDNEKGVVAQGFLNVVNGGFSGVLQFHSYASTGRLDVFSTDRTGVEINEIQMAVNF